MWHTFKDDSINEFLKYFKEGFADKVPSTNNGLESNNKWMKEDLIRRRMPLGQFLNAIINTTEPAGMLQLVL